MTLIYNVSSELLVYLKITEQTPNIQYILLPIVVSCFVTKV